MPCKGQDHFQGSRLPLQLATPVSLANLLEPSQSNSVCAVVQAGQQWRVMSVPILWNCYEEIQIKVSRAGTQHRKDTVSAY